VVATGEAVGTAFIVLEFIESGRRDTRFWENFGAALAALHQVSAPSFGLAFNNYIGSLPQSNRQHSKWTDFFTAERIMPQMHLASEKGLLSRRHRAQFEKIEQKLTGLFPAEMPSLLHGDLWSGNFITDETGFACLVDPAVYFGHREAELAFTRLFGGFDERFYSAYNEQFPLEKGFRERQDIYNLYPLLVHLNLFGTGYLPEIENILNRFAS
jgi:fructosamine-3-kinase